MFLLEHRINKAIAACLSTFPWFAGLDAVRSQVVLMMTYQLGDRRRGAVQGDGGGDRAGRLRHGRRRDARQQMGAGRFSRARIPARARHAAWDLGRLISERTPTMSKNSLRLWGIGLLGAAINSAVGAVTMVIVEPQDFDPFGGGMVKLAKVAIVLAISGAALYLKTHPIPTDDLP
jgi:hypothetical protein